MIRSRISLLVPVFVLLVVGITAGLISCGGGGGGSGYRAAHSLSTPDTTAPSSPTALVAVAAGAASINLSWTASSDNVGVTAYIVKRDGLEVGSSVSPNYADSGLSGATNYTYKVVARDAAGNLSGDSVPASALTATTADTTPPSVPTGLAAAGVLTIKLSWTASTGGAVDYIVMRDGAQVGTSSSASYADSVPIAGTYSYTVTSRDAAGNVSQASASATVTASSQFPLHVDASNRYLVDAWGNPFLLHADSAWSLIADLSDEDAEQYLEDRRKKGFNAVIVNLLEHKFSSKATRNFYNDPPFDGAVSGFSGPSDYSKRNEAYFAHADKVIQMAAAKGILVLLTPSYLGSVGGDEGWYQEMVANGSTKMRAYGQYLGQRYASYSNILWVHGGDFNPPLADKPLVSEIALGIKEGDTHSLHTAHCSAGNSALNCWRNEPWLQVNSIYTYDSVPANSQDAYQDTSSMPFFLIESGYENEHMPDGNEQHVRVQAYQALLSGAMGQAFGNNPIWHFDGPPLGTVIPAAWQDWLPSAGAQSMVNVRSVFSQREWWKLVPDFSNTLLTDGVAGSGGTQYDLAVAAKASDGSFAIVYMPDARTLKVDLSKLAGLEVNARWVDPASGAFIAIPGSPFQTSSVPQSLTPPLNNTVNRTGPFTDWVLVLESTP
jgi:chitodextrinase